MTALVPIALPIDIFGKVKDVPSMLVKVTSKRQVTFPESVLKALGAGPGSHLELQPSGDGFLLRSHSIDHGKLAPLRGLISPAHKAFDLNHFRNESHDASLRD